MNLGDFTQGEPVFYIVEVRDPATNQLVTPDSISATLRDPEGTWTTLTVPLNQDSAVGSYGESITTDANTLVGQHTIRVYWVVGATNGAIDLTYRIRAAGVNELANTLLQSSLNQITLTVLEGAAPVSTALIEVKDPSEAVLYKTGLTDVNGNITFGGLLAGDYHVIATASGYDITTTNITVVNGTNTPVEIQATATNPPSVPADPDVCNLFGYTTSIVGKEYAGKVITITPYDDTDQFVAGRGILNMATTVTTDINGYFSVDVLRSVKVRIVCKDLGYDRVAALVTSTKDWKDIVDVGV